METNLQAILPEQIPSDITVQVGQTSFYLHKLMLLPKSNYVRKLVSELTDVSTIDLSDIPGGPEAFEKVVKFCYDVNFEITVHNVAAIHCAAKYLQITDEHGDSNLAERTDDFLSQVALQSLTGAIVVLKSSEELLPYAVDFFIVEKCIKIASAKACVEANFPSHSPPVWWMEELSILGIAFFEQIIIAMRSSGAAGLSLVGAIIIYTKKTLENFMRDRSESNTEESEQRELLEAIVSLITSEQPLFPVNFLCCLLRNAIFLRANDACKNELEKRISAILEHTTVGNLFALSLAYDEDKLNNLETVKRIITRFVDNEKSVAVFNAGNFREVFSTAMQRVAKTVDAFLAEIALYDELCIAKFNGIANLIPKEARRSDDNLYRAIDIYLKAHPQLDELEREKVCSVMNPHRLSSEAHAHASQNKRLPMQVVVHALYYNQLKLRSGGEDENKKSDAIAMRNQVGVDASMAKENEALRTELLKMKMYVQDLQKLNQKTSPRTNNERMLGRWNLFNKNESRDTRNVCDWNEDVTHSRKRRLPVS